MNRVIRRRPTSVHIALIVSAVALAYVVVAPPAGILVKSLRAPDGTVTAGQLLALLGPSGCGKTTTLRLVAGLEQPSDGRITLDGRVLADGTRAVPTEKRRLGMVFQSYALWPHMNVFDNVAYGLRRAKVARPDVARRVSDALRLVGMDGYEKRAATELTGGQQQRIAIARALVTRPALMLFDEPLSNLDAVLRESMRFEIRALQQEQGVTAIYVTHSQDEALALADVVAVLKDGEIQQLGAPEELYTRPRNRFVAGFVGLANIIDTPPAVLAGRGSGSVAVRPENLTIAPAGTAPRSGGWSLPGKIVDAVFGGNMIDYFVHVAGIQAPLRVQTLPPATVRGGAEVTLHAAIEDIIPLDD